MIKLFFASVLAGSGLLLAATDSIPNGGVPVQTVVTIEAVHGKSVPRVVSARRHGTPEQ